MASERSKAANPYSLRLPEQVGPELAERLKQLRLVRGWRQVTLAERSGVSLGSLRRFEQTGRISLENLLALAFTLGRLDDFEALFQLPEARSIAELEALDELRRSRPKRGRK